MGKLIVKKVNGFIRRKTTYEKNTEYITIRSLILTDIYSNLGVFLKSYKNNYLYEDYSAIIPLKELKSFLDV